MEQFNIAPDVEPSTAGNGTPDGEPAADKTDLEVAGLREQVSALTKSTELMMDMFKQNSVQQLQPAVADAPEPTAQNVDVPGYGEDLEMKSRSEFGTLVENRIMAKIQNDLLAPLMQEVRGMATQQGKTTAQSQVERMQDKHEDFADWGDELSKTVTEIPNISLNDAYTLVRARDPEKTQRLDAEYTPKPPENEPTEPTNPAATPNPPMRPSAGGASPTVSMDFEEAANHSWKENSAGLSEALSSMEQ